MNRYYKKLEQRIESNLHYLGVRFDNDYDKIKRDYDGRVLRIRLAYADQYKGRESHILVNAYRGTEQTFKKIYEMKGA